jgi:hypothetical protein
MQESRALRRSRLFREVGHHRHLLEAMKCAQSGGALAHEGVAARIKEITEELSRMEAELHALNVEQIREELGNL